MLVLWLACSEFGRPPAEGSSSCLRDLLNESRVCVDGLVWSPSELLFQLPQATGSVLSCLPFFAGYL